MEFKNTTFIKIHTSKYKIYPILSKMIKSVRLVHKYLTLIAPITFSYLIVQQRLEK